MKTAKLNYQSPVKKNMEIQSPWMQSPWIARKRYNGIISHY